MNAKDFKAMIERYFLQVVKIYKFLNDSNSSEKACNSTNLGPSSKHAYKYLFGKRSSGKKAKMSAAQKHYEVTLFL